MNRFIYLRPHKRQRMTVSLPAELLERMRDAALLDLRYHHGRTDLFSDGGSASNLETQNGRPFSPRLQDLKPGRPRANNANPRLYLKIYNPYPVRYAAPLASSLRALSHLEDQV